MQCLVSIEDQGLGRYIFLRKVSQFQQLKTMSQKDTQINWGGGGEVDLFRWKFPVKKVGKYSLIWNSNKHHIYQKLVLCFEGH